MNAPLATGLADFLARYDALRGQLPGDGAARDAAAAVLRANGLPSLRDEAWHFTNLRPLAELSFGHAVPTDPAPLLALLPNVDAPRIVLVDGRVRREISDIPAGISVACFAEAPMFGSLARPETEPLVALNTMLAEDGAVLTVADGVDAGLVVLAHLGAGGASHPRHRICLGQGARLVLLEINAGEGTYFHNPVTEATIARDATLTHIRVQDEAATAFHLGTVYADIAQGGSYDSFSLALGARLARMEMHVRLAGDQAGAHLNAAQLLAGNQHADFTTVIRHDAPRGASRQTVKNVLAGRSRGVFQGKIEVARGAQKTDGYQMNQALLLSPEAEIDSKPQLEIFADDVKCSHGATVGELDAEQLFYLRSRGVPETEARAMLIRAFLTEAIDTVSNDSSRAVLESAIDAWWQRQAA